MMIAIAVLLLAGCTRVIVVERTCPVEKTAHIETRPDCAVTGLIHISTEIPRWPYGLQECSSTTTGNCWNISPNTYKNYITTEGRIDR